VRLILGMSVEVRPDERAQRHDAQAARHRIVEDRSCETRADAAALELWVNHGVREDDALLAQAVLGERDDSVAIVAIRYLPTSGSDIVG
jgi:hypothetical protein